MSSLEILSLVIAFILIIEGIIPLLYPSKFKETLSYILQLNDKTLRMFGLTCIISGLIIYYLVYST
ncbi:MAG: DUF2065 domain-containing protein [Gammaproteobacteria bacterium]